VHFVGQSTILTHNQNFVLTPTPDGYYSIQAQDESRIRGYVPVVTVRTTTFKGIQQTMLGNAVCFS
jgi:hypothetical protein